ncbi:3-hydroxyacyl-CoA dehydrogenase family protein [Ectobacillus panaciterrae]|uniref:3-hydroxyacyl-CoA dehydrogenase family protein n=1 Tax=Ectobacillus panaciterrae TaxID=363872 RepID=UPI0004181517|nr:3-hydroxyacyl-CoA dehydrogenase family protein [Ectobacillus panaciterrae]
MIQNISVIGSGIMGSGIAQALAMGGKGVKLYDVSEESLQKAYSGITKSLSRFVKAGRMTEEEAQEIVANIVAVTTLEEACKDVELVIEAVPENLALKEEGVAGKEEIDKAIRLGLNYPMGPFELADYVGLDTMLFASQGLTEAFGERFRAPQALVKLVEAGHLGKKTGKGFYDYTKEKEGVKR